MATIGGIEVGNIILGLILIGIGVYLVRYSRRKKQVKV